MRKWNQRTPNNQLHTGTFIRWHTTTLWYYKWHKQPLGQLVTWSIITQFSTVSDTQSSAFLRFLNISYTSLDLVPSQVYKFLSMTLPTSDQSLYLFGIYFVNDRAKCIISPNLYEIASAKYCQKCTQWWNQNVPNLAISVIFPLQK